MMLSYPRGATGPKYWEWSGKVQERRAQKAAAAFAAFAALAALASVVSVRQLSAGLLLLGALSVGGPTRAPSQAALTPLDSAILNSQPTKRLVITASLVRRLSLLAAGLEREVVLCLQGSVSGDTATVRDFVMPDLRSVIADSIPFAVVSVGRSAQSVTCWWRRVQAVVNRHVKFLPRFPRQWTELPAPGGVADPRRHYTTP